MPEPLLPPDVDIREFPDLPISIQRFRDSGIVSTRSDSEIVAALMLWLSSFHQVPAASLPVNDIELAKLAGYGKAVKDFKKIRVGATHGFIQCSDGRLWHPVVAEKAAHAWNKKLTERHRKAVDRARKFNDELKARGEKPLPLPAQPFRLVRDEESETPSWHYVDHNGVRVEGRFRTKGHSAQADDSDGIPTEPLRNRVADSDGIPAPKGKEKKEKEREWIVPTPTASEPSTSTTLTPTAKARSPSGAKGGPAWEAYSAAYTERYGVAPLRNAKVNSLLTQLVDLVGIDDAPAVAAFYLASNRQLYVAATHPLSLLVRDADALRTAWLTNRHATESEARMADRTQARGNVWDQVREELKNAP